MTTPWLKRIRVTGELLVFNQAQSWSKDVTKAITTFNNLSLGCKYKAANDANSAHVVITLAKSKLSKQEKANKKIEYFTINHYGDVATTDDKFQSDSLNGETSAIEDKKRKELFFAGIFLPGDYPNPTADQKEMIVLHELIHAAGMDEHDSQGIMFSTFAVDGKKVIEYLHDKGAAPMPPVRLGGMTRCKVQLAWMADAKEDDINQADACKKAP